MVTAAAPISGLNSELAAERVTLITPNRRLAIFHKRAFDRAQQQAGRMAWPSPDILPYPAWVERIWRNLALRVESGALPHLLDGVQSQLLWEQVIRKSDTVNGLLNIAQTARQAASAWTLVRAWHLLPAMQKFALHDDATMFLAWTEQYQGTCREQHLIDGAVLPDALARLIGDGVDESLQSTRILTAGFDIVTPQQHHLWCTLEEAGIEVRAIELQRQNGPIQRARVAFDAESDELRACAAWARRRLEKNSAQRIAIVVPDLQSQRNRIARELTDALLPGLRAGGMPEPGYGAAFNISLGQPLSDYALVRDALDLLAFSVSPLRPMPFLSVSAMLRSPYIAAAEQEEAARAALDAKLRETATLEIHFTALRKQLANDARLQHMAQACERLLDCLARAAALGVTGTSATARGKTSSSSALSPHDWSRHFGAVLTAWGFPGERPLDSVNYQVMAKFRDALASLATLASVQPCMRVDDALQQLRRIAADTMFQPETGDGNAPIQVLGILESAGQSFDALWVTGLSDDAWPLLARPNPFIPSALQRNAGVPEASAPASLALDRQITAGWLNSANEVVVSYVRPEGSGDESEPDRGASALIRDMPLLAIEVLLGGPVPVDYSTRLQALRAVEAIPDTTLEPLPAPTALRGGATVMRDQAACAFRAFARHRLGAKSLDAPLPGPDALVRGNLLHRVLYLVWEALPDHASFIALNADAIAAIANKAAADAVAEAHARGDADLTGQFAHIERARLSRVACEWLAYERQRPPFTVLERESPKKVGLGGLKMDLRLDRVDQLTDGTHALIDYKTGVASLASWLGDRPDEPQLPLYYHTADMEISALAFAGLKRGKTFGFEGVSVIEGLLPDVVPIENRKGQTTYASWDELTKSWEISLAALAAEFVRGEAVVNPKHGQQTCAQCDLQAICRIAELTREDALDDDPESPPRDNE